MFEHTAKGRAAMAQTERDNEGMFQAARKDEQVLDELLTQLDFADEYDYFYSIVIQLNKGAADVIETEHLDFFNHMIVKEDSKLSEIVKHLIKTNEQYARRFEDMLIEEYKGFYS